MQRITITIDDELLLTVDAMVAERGYASRSEAFRDLVRESEARVQTGALGKQCIATLTYVYDHATRDLARRITQAHHERHDLAVASMRVHLDHQSLLEMSVLRGKTQDVTEFANGVASQRGVRYANLHAIPVMVERAKHHHGDDASQHDHFHA